MQSSRPSDEVDPSAGLARLKSSAMFGEVPPSVSGVIHCLDCLVAKHPTFDAKTIEELLHRWVRQVQVVDIDKIADPQIKAAVQQEVKAKSGTDFHVVHEMRRILQLIVLPLVEARRRKEGAIGRSLARFLESSLPASSNYGATSIQVPLHPGLYAAVLAVEAAHIAGRLPRLRDIAKALKEAGIEGGESSAKRYAVRLRAAGVQFDRGAGRPRSKSKQGGKPVRSFVLRKRGAKAGIRLIDYASLAAYIRSHAEGAGDSTEEAFEKNREGDRP